MRSSPASEPRVSVGDLMRRRLREIKSTPEALAEAIDLPVSYVDEVIAGSRVVAPGRSDVYTRITSFLRLGRNDLLNCLPPELSSSDNNKGPGAQVRRLLLALCDPATAEQLDRRHGQRGTAEFTDIVRRLLDVAQGAVRRLLDDHIQLRLAATERGATYPMMRLNVLDFLDATPSTVTPEGVTEFLVPRVARWDVDLTTGVLRVVMGTSQPRPLPRGRALGQRSIAAALQFEPEGRAE